MTVWRRWCTGRISPPPPSARPACRGETPSLLLQQVGDVSNTIVSYRKLSSCLILTCCCCKARTKCASGKNKRQKYIFFCFVVVVVNKCLFVVYWLDLGSPEGIAIDHMSRTMFWTDSMKDRIEVASLDGTQRRVLIDTDLVNPRAIIVDPVKGYVCRPASPCFRPCWRIYRTGGVVGL